MSILKPDKVKLVFLPTVSNEYYDIEDEENDFKFPVQLPTSPSDATDDKKFQLKSN